MRSCKVPFIHQCEHMIYNSPTYGRLERRGHHSPCGLLGAGQQREEGGQQGEHRVTRHDDGVGAHTARPREPETFIVPYNESVTQ